MPPPMITGRARILLNVLLAAAMVRLLRLDEHSLWLDEAVTWWNATRPTWGETVFAEPNHPPVWWVVTRLWGGVMPLAHEVSLRFPAGLCGVAAVALVFLAVRRVSDPRFVPARGGLSGGDDRTALWVAGLAAANALWVEQAQEARMYAALLAETLLLSWLYLRWLDRPTRGRLVGYFACAVVALYTHYFAFWTLLAHAVHAVLLARRARGGAQPFDARPVVVAQALASLLLAPWLLAASGRGFYGVGSNPAGAPAALLHAMWRMGTGPALVALDRPRLDAGPAAVFAQEPLTIAATALAWAVPIVLGVRAVWRDPGGRAFVLSLVAVPVVGVLALALWRPLVHERYLVFLAPWLLYLAVLGARTAPRVLRPVLLGGLVALHAAGLLAYHGAETAAGRALGGDHPYGREAWREAHRFVADRTEPGDLVLLHAPCVRMPWAFYEAHAARPGAFTLTPATAPGIPLPASDAPPGDLPSTEALLRDLPGLRTAKQVFLVLSHEATPGRDDALGRVLEAIGPLWGAFRVEGPIVFPRQNGIRVFRVTRS